VLYNYVISVKDFINLTYVRISTVL